MVGAAREAPSALAAGGRAAPTPTYSQGGTSDNIGGQHLQPGELVARIDTLSFTSRRRFSEVLATVQAAIESKDFTPMKHGKNGYRQGALLVNGAMVCWTPGRDDVFVNLPGKVCTGLHFDTIIALGMSLQARVSRLDVAVDGCAFTPQDVYSAWQEGNVATKVQRDGQRSHEWISSPSGQTFYIGSPESDRRSRCYTKDEEGRRYEDGSPVVRWETQYRHGRAANVWAQLQDLYLGGKSDSFGRLALGLISDHARFCDASQDTNISRCANLPFWEAFLGQVERVSTWVPRVVVTSIEAIERYLFSQVAPSLATWLHHLDCSGKDSWAALSDLIQNGWHKRAPRHRHLLATLHGSA